MLNFRTRSYINAVAVPGKFPLVIYLCSYNGMGYENFSLFEDLAKKGFLVVSISSIGRYPGDMTMKNADMLEQVNDALFGFQTVSASSEADISRIGILGYSWGGLSAAVLAGKIPGVSCLVSLEGSEFHHYGKEKEENADFEGIRTSQDFKKLLLSMPYLRLESSPALNKETADSVYNFSEKLLGNKFIFQIDSAEHQDFSCLPTLVKTSGACKNNPAYSVVSRLTESFLEDHLTRSDSFPRILAREMDKTIRKK